jgi:uncharacterized protein with HEPN domain
MFDKELVLEILEQIGDATQRIQRRFEPIRTADDFTNSEAGVEKLDAICMQLIAVGECLKNLDRMTENSLLPKYTGIDWKKIKGMRDIISHHYFDVDADLIYDVCANHVGKLDETIQKMIKDLRSPNPPTDPANLLDPP